MTDKLSGVRLKIERAKKHVSDLEVIVRAFCDARPYKLRPEYDPQTRCWSYVVESVQPIPPEVPLVTGDAVHCLRSALDQLAFQLFLANNPGADAREDGRRVYFPIFEDAAAYFPKPNKPESGRDRAVKGLSQAAIQAIDAIQPYGGGKGEPLWALHGLDVTDKHRLLITTVLGNFMGLDWWQMNKLLPPGTTFGIYVSPGPVEVGEKVGWLPPDVEPKEHPEARSGIAFGEPGVFESKPILPTLRQLTEFTENVINQLARLL